MRLAFVLLVALAWPGVALAQLAPPPDILPGFKLHTAPDGAQWWTRQVGGWQVALRPTKYAWMHPPVAVLDRELYESLSSGPAGSIGIGHGPVINYGAVLPERPGAPGFTSGGGVGHTHTSDCDDGRCPLDDEPASPDAPEVETGWIQRALGIDTTTIEILLGVIAGLAAVGVGLLAKRIL